jgi:hypothetical protein
MTNKNKPDWNDLQNEQAYTNAWQIDKLWTTAKKLPVYFWVMFILLTATLANTVRLHYAMVDIVKAQFEKTQANRGVAKKYVANNREVMAGLRDQIEHLNGVIEKTQKKNAGMRAAIQRKDATIADLVNKVGEKYVLRESDKHKHGLGN